jgi:hypothetical protein
MAYVIREPDLQALQQMLDSFEGLRLGPASAEALRSSAPDLSMDVLCEREVPLRDGLRPERPVLNRSLVNRILAR